MSTHTTSNEIIHVDGSVATYVNPFQPLFDMVLNSVSDKTKRDYARALNDFMAWYVDTNQTTLNKACVNAHLQFLRDQGTPVSSQNQRLSALRKFVAEAADNGLIGEAVAQGISRVKPTKIQGRKLGNWLNKAQASQMLNSPDTTTLKGLRDKAVLAIMLGCGLRREELTTLTVDHLQQREGRWVITDLQGKHHRVRSIPMAGWIKGHIDTWLQAAGITDGLLFRQIRRHGVIVYDNAMSVDGVWDIVKLYSPVPNLAPHDLRRTFAKLAHKGGAGIEQISLSLGHADIKTTQLYLGVELELENAPSDFINL